MERHLEYTGSTVAAGLLKDWPKAASKFVKVMPRDYRRVLEEMRFAQAAPAAEVVGAARG